MLEASLHKVSRSTEKELELPVLFQRTHVARGCDVGMA